MKNIIKTIAAILAVCVILAGAVFAAREYKARIPVITVKEYNLVFSPGDTVDTGELVEVNVKGDYEYDCNMEYERKCGEMDDNGVLRILDNGQTAMDTIILNYTATGSVHKSTSESVHIIVQNPISADNSYEVSVSDVRFRDYNNLEDQGNGVFKRGDGLSVDDYEIVFHSADSVSSMDELEKEIKRYAKEKYLLNEETNNYRSEDVVLPSGKKARKIAFSAIRNEGKFLELRGSSGLLSTVVIYAFSEGDRYFFIDDCNSWGTEYEMEQIANTVE